MTVDVLTQILQDDQHKQYNRAIALAIVNETKSTWTAKGTYLSSSTTSDLVVPGEIQHTKAGIYSARQVGYMPIIGISGVLTFSLSDGNTLALMFSGPYNYTFCDNWWNAKVYNDKSIEANKLRHSLMSYMLIQHAPSKAKTSGTKRVLERVRLPEDT